MKLRTLSVPVIWHHGWWSSELHSSWFSFYYHLPETSGRICSQPWLVWSLRTWFLGNNLCVKSTGGESMDGTFQIFLSIYFNLTFHFSVHKNIGNYTEKWNHNFQQAIIQDYHFPMTWNSSVYFIHKQTQKPSAAVQASLLVNLSLLWNWIQSTKHFLDSNATSFTTNPEDFKYRLGGKRHCFPLSASQALQFLA